MSPDPATSRDVLGYLRWTATSCVRCGYKRNDCTCPGGFAKPPTGRERRGQWAEFRHSLRCSSGMRCLGGTDGHRWHALHDTSPPVVTCERCGTTEVIPYAIKEPAP